MNRRPGVTIQIRGAGYTVAEIADLGRDLRETVLTLDVDDARAAPAGPAPPGAKAGEALAYGTLLVTVTPILVAGLVDVVSTWLRRQPDTVELAVGDIQFKGRVTAEQRDALVAAVLRQLTERP